jgi:transcription initiation factor TFIIE subunit alpha
VLGDFEEDRKPNIEYLDSLNEHNKRSRSVEDEGDAERKQARVGLLADGWGQGQEENGDLLSMNGVEGSGVDVGDVSAEEDPIVYGLFFCFSLFQASFSNGILNKPSF